MNIANPGSRPKQRNEMRTNIFIFVAPLTKRRKKAQISEFSPNVQDRLMNNDKKQDTLKLLE